MPGCHIVGVYPPPAVIEERVIAYNALRLFANRFLRQIPVVDPERRVRGILTIRDVIRFVHSVVSRNENLIDKLVNVSAGELARKPVETLTYGEFSIHDVFGIIASKGIGALPIVTKDGRVLGLVNEEHLANILKNNSYIGMGVKVTDIMTSNVVAAPVKGTRVRDAIRLMSEGGFRHLPLVDDKGSAVAIVTARDIVRFLMRGETVKLLEEGRVEEVYNTPIEHVARFHPVKVDATMSMQDVLDFMALSGVGGVLVEQDGKLVGIVTDMDVIVRLPAKMGETFTKFIENMVPPCP